LFAIDTVTGGIKWSNLDYFEYSSSLASPAVSADGSTIYMGTESGWFYALNATNGTLLHSWNLGGGVETTPAIASDGTIYVVAALSLFALNPDGSTKWTFVGSDNVSSIGIVSSPAIGAAGEIYSTDGTTVLSSVSLFPLVAEARVPACGLPGRLGAFAFFAQQSGHCLQ
jgi:outer membrane protein assembly factor BamB